MISNQQKYERGRKNIIVRPTLCCVLYQSNLNAINIIYGDNVIG